LCLREVLAGLLQVHAPQHPIEQGSGHSDFQDHKEALFHKKSNQLYSKA
jgi:hypothetical protein